MRGKTPAQPAKRKKAVVPGRARKAGPTGKGARKAPDRKPQNYGQAGTSHTTVASAADWPFPKAAWPELKDEDREPPPVDPISENGLPKRLRRAP